MAGSKWIGAIVLAMLLAGCASPLERCIAQATQDLRAVEAAIEVTQGNIARGYAIDRVEVVETRYVLCRYERGNILTDGIEDTAPDPGPTFCFEDFVRVVDRQRRIDLVSERAHLALLKTRRDELARAAAPAVAACRAQFPEV